jgi:hypothetical protein
MIKRITDPVEFKKALNEIFDLFEHENEHAGHQFLRHNKEYISKAFAHKQILAWDFFVWGNFNSQDKCDAIIAFVNHKSEKFGEEIFAEYIWLSSNPKMGYKLLATALRFAREKEFKYVTMNRVMGHPKSSKISRFYKKLGFLKDTETYIAKL